MEAFSDLVLQAKQQQIPVQSLRAKAEQIAGVAAKEIAQVAGLMQQYRTNTTDVRCVWMELLENARQDETEASVTTLFRSSNVGAGWELTTVPDDETYERFVLMRNSRTVRIIPEAGECGGDSRGVIGDVTTLPEHDADAGTLQRFIARLHAVRRGLAQLVADHGLDNEFRAKDS